MNPISPVLPSARDISVPGYTFKKNAPRDFLFSWGKEKPSSKNYNRHPSYFWAEKRKWIDKEICPLLPIFNTKKFETGATCQGDKKKGHVGEFWIYQKKGTSIEEIFDLACWMIDKMQPFYVKSEGFYPGFEMHLQLRSKTCAHLVIYMDNRILKDFTEIFGANPLPKRFR